jgi:type I restriction enzyme, S subunit
MDAEWQTVPLQTLCDPHRGITYGIVQPGAHTEDGVGILRAEDVHNGFIATDSLLKVAPNVDAVYERSRLRGGEVLLTLVGAYFGKAAVAQPQHVGLNTARAVGVIPVLGEPDFIAYALRSPVCQRFMQERATTTAQPTLNLRDVADIPIPWPDRNTRAGIATLLRSLDDKLDLNRRMNETLEETARALFKSWFVDFDPVRAKADGRQPFGMNAATAALFPDGFETSELGEMPSGWRSGGIYEIAVVNYGAPYASEHFNEQGIGLPLVRIRDLANHLPIVFTPEAHRADIIVEPGDIVVGMDGEFRAHIWRGPRARLNQRMCRFAPTDRSSRAFLLFTIEPRLRFFEATKIGTTVIHLGKGDIDTFRLLIPPAAVLDRYAEVAEPLLGRALTNATEGRCLASVRDYLLPKLLSGEVRVRDAEKLVEAVP